MRLGRVYLWHPDPGHPLGGRVAQAVVPLPRLEDHAEGPPRLRGRYVLVRNGGAVKEFDPATGVLRAVPIGDAAPDEAGNFLFEPGRGGGRLDKVERADPDFLGRYVQASHFGEVNSYFHLDLIASYVDGLLGELGVPSLPPVVAVVSAHHAVTTRLDGTRDGVGRGGRWLPFQGGHYRLPARRFDVGEHEPLAVTGEIHLGPGWRLTDHGALVEAAGGRYRANASHNAGILYHEYGHHLTRHTADFRANALRREGRQDNRKTAMDEGTCDYWAATVLGTPHIWAWHRRHDCAEIHPRSLVSPKAMSDFDAGPGADPHANGTIWGAALWDLRTRLGAEGPDGERRADLLVLRSLLLIGQINGPGAGPTAREVRALRKDFSVGLSTLLLADEIDHEGRHRDAIMNVFTRRGIAQEASIEVEGGPSWALEAEGHDGLRPPGCSAEGLSTQRRFGIHE
jgi:hypothetical protein